MRVKQAGEFGDQAVLFGTERAGGGVMIGVGERVINLRLFSGR